MKHILIASLFIFSICSNPIKAQDSTYYEKGKIAAQEDITKIELNIKRMGFISGLVFSYYGTGVGYAVYQFRNIDVPKLYTSKLNPDEKKEFERGYRFTYKNESKSLFVDSAAGGASCQALIFFSLLGYTIFDWITT